MKHDYFIEWFNPYEGIKYTILKDCNEKQLNDFVECLKSEFPNVKIFTIK